MREIRKEGGTLEVICVIVADLQWSLASDASSDYCLQRSLCSDHCLQRSLCLKLNVQPGEALCGQQALLKRRVRQEGVC